MTPLPILVAGDERLARVAAPVTAIDRALAGDAARLVATLEDFRRRRGFGRAIAAPQVGIDRRMIAFSLGADPFVVLNPSIVWRSDETFAVWDDCLSVPGRLVRVERHRSITVAYDDAKLRRRTWSRLPPDMSELVQHEVDHLDGVLMTARATGEDAVQPSERWAELVGASRPRHRLSLDRIREAARVLAPLDWQTRDHDGVRVTVAIAGLDGATDLALVERAGAIALAILAKIDPVDAVVVPDGEPAIREGVTRWIAAASPSTEIIGAADLARFAGRNVVAIANG